MSFDRKKGTGYDEVRTCVLDCIHNRSCPKDMYVRIRAEKIAEVIGISPQAVNIHIREMVRRGLVIRLQRFYYALPHEDKPVTVSENVLPVTEPITLSRSQEAIPQKMNEPVQKIASQGHTFRNCHFYIVTEDARDEPSL